MSTLTPTSSIAQPIAADIGRRLHYLTLQATTEGQAAYAHVHEIVHGLNVRGWQTEVFEPSALGSDKIGNTGGPATLGKMLAFLRLQWRLVRHADRPDILYVRAHPFALPALLWAQLRGIPSVAEVNSTYEDIFSMYSWTTSLRWLVEGVGDLSLRAANRLITVTPELKQWLELRFPNKPVSVVPNGANINVFRPDVPPGLSHLRPYVIFAGAMSPWQGIEVLLKATHHQDWPAAVRLVIAGDGSCRASVEVEALHNERIVYLGKQSYKVIPSLFTGALAAFSVGTSLRKNFSPLKLYEALACGIPVIASDQPGQSRLVRELACGLIVPPEDSAAVARAVAQLASNLEESGEMGRRGYHAVQAGYSWQHRADQTGNILLETLRGDTFSSAVGGGLG